jgi:hypothetical protein
MFNGARADFYLLALLSSSVLRVTFFVDYRFTHSAIPRSLFFDYDHIPYPNCYTLNQVNQTPSKRRTLVNNFITTYQNDEHQAPHGPRQR